MRITDNYTELKAHYDDVLNKDQTLVKTSNDEPTPIACVEEMVSKVPETFWQKKNLRILDPCCGCGNFFVSIFQKLRQYHDAPIDVLHFNEINEERVGVVKSIFGDDINMTQQDFTTYETPYDFDMIVANPPYARLLPNGKRAAKNHNMIGAFINKSLELLRPGGLLLFITPDNWMSYADRNEIARKLTERQILHLDIHRSKKYFPKVGSSFTWYLVENKPHYKATAVEGIWKGQEYSSKMQIETRSFIPLYWTNEVQNIFLKTIDADNRKVCVETSSDLHKYTKKDLISAERQGEFQHKLIHTPTQIVWSSRPHKWQDGWKVFIPTTSYYKPFVDNCGMTQSIAFVRCESKAAAERLAETLSHPLYKFLNDVCRYGNFNNIRVLQRFPWCDGGDRVLQTFGITDKEEKLL